MNDVKNHPQINIRLAPELKNWVHEQAKYDHRSVNNWLTHLIEQAKLKTATHPRLSTEPEA